MPSQIYQLNGATSFTFPFHVREPDQIRLELFPGEMVPPSDYEVIGTGPFSTGVTVVWPDAITDGSANLVIVREIPPDQVSDFTRDRAITGLAVNDEVNNIYEIIRGVIAELRRTLRWPVFPPVANQDLILDPLSEWFEKFIFINSAGVPTPAEFLPDGQMLTRDQLGRILFPLTETEALAGIDPEAAYFRPWFLPYDVRRYGATDTGSTDEVVDSTDAFQRWADVLQFGGEGFLGEGGVYHISGNIEIKFSDTGTNGRKVTYNFGSSTISCSGTGDKFRVFNGQPVPRRNKLRMRGGQFIYPPDGEGCDSIFRFTNLNSSIIEHVDIQGQRLVTHAMFFENSIAEGAGQSERNRIYDCRLQGCQHLLRFVGAGGDQSFARTIVRGLMMGAAIKNGVSGNGILIEGSVYDSEFSGIRGNVGASGEPGGMKSVFFINGNMAGSFIDGIGVEQGNRNQPPFTYIFEIGGGNVRMPEIRMSHTFGERWLTRERMPVSITSTGTTATVNFPNHLVRQFDRVTIYGADQEEYNVNHVRVTEVIDDDNFTYEISAPTVSPATGNIFCAREQVRRDTINPGSTLSTFFTDVGYASNQRAFGHGTSTPGLDKQQEWTSDAQFYTWEVGTALSSTDRTVIHELAGAAINVNRVVGAIEAWNTEINQLPMRELKIGSIRFATDTTQAKGRINFLVRKDFADPMVTNVFSLRDTGAINALQTTNGPIGRFNLTATTIVIPNVSVTENSEFSFYPVNNEAAAYVSGGNILHVSLRNAGTSFEVTVVNTEGAATPTGNEIFSYRMFN